MREHGILKIELIVEAILLAIVLLWHPADSIGRTIDIIATVILIILAIVIIVQKLQKRKEEKS